jgi:hypothetical protein
MFVIHGHYNVKEVRGVVAEHCRACATITVHEVLDHFRRAHVYWIPMPFAKSHVSTVCICGACKTSRDIARTAFDCTVPVKQRGQVSLGELIAATNVPLATLAMLADQTEVRPPGGPRLHELKELLLPFYKEPEGALLLDRLAEWPLLDWEERQALADEVAAANARYEMLARAEQLLLEMHKTIPYGLALLWGCGLGFGLLLAGVLIGLISGQAFPRDEFVVWLVGSVAVGVTVGLAAFFIVSGRQRRWWMRERLLPEARRAGIPAEALLEALERYQCTSTSPESMKALKSAKKELEAALDATWR